MALVVEYHEELEIDLAPQVDLLDFWRGRLSARRLELLIRHLDPSSATFQAIDPEAAAEASWAVTDYLLAHLIDMTSVAHGLKTKQGQPVPAFPRPAEAIRQRKRDEARLQALIAQRDRVKQRRAQLTREGVTPDG